MGMNLHLRDDQAEALRQRADLEGASVHTIVLRAVDEYLAGSARQADVARSAKEQAARWSELMKRLK
ncbi:CopG family transcriptional regulator [Streptomyces sp. AC154]|uniref:CopG family transcriptional regulator n=1 Tax=Streptomyces sp. AC154 TaxID=3143184 RepID=UPI003F7F6154